MTFSTDQKNAAARALRSALPGLDLGVARAWVTCEQGDNFNFLGLTNAQGLLKFASFDAAAVAYAKILTWAYVYRGIAESLGKDKNLQARAIVRSPWHLGAAGLAAHGGVDPYYQRIFRSLGFAV